MTDLSSAPPEQRQRRSLFGFYSAGAFREIIPIYPLYSVMFLDNGITPFELSALFIIWALVGLILEVPSGALADAVSRKWLVVASGFLKSLAFVSWFLWQDFWGYAFGFILWGIGSTFRSGAFEALLYETLKSWDRTHDFNHHYGRIRALGTMCVLVGEASGGVLITLGYDAVLLVSALVPLLATVPFVLLVADVRVRGEKQSGGLIRGAINEAKQNPTILVILFITTFMLTVHGVFDEYVPPLLQEQGFSLSLIAFLAIPVFSAAALGQYLADRIESISYRQQLLLIGAGTFMLIPGALFGPWYVVASVTVFFFAFGLAGTLVETQLQHAITGDARATVTSIIGLGDSIGAIIWFFLFGLVADQNSITTATIALAAATILLCVVASRFRFASN